MKVTLGDAQGIVAGLPEVMKEKLPLKMGYWFSRTIRELGVHMQDMQEVKNKLLDKYATKDKKGQFIEKNGQFDVKDLAGFNKELKPLLEQEIEIKYDGVTLEELEKVTAEQECPECKKKIPAQVTFKGIDIFNLGKLVLDPPEGK